MIDPEKYVVSTNDTITDVDLNHDAVHLTDGRRLTDELAEQLADDTLTEARHRNLVPGRKIGPCPV